MIKMVEIVHNNYEKITDVVMWLNNEWVLKFTTTLNKYSDKYGRQNYHKEIGYMKNNDVSINISREFDYFLSIETVRKNKETGMKDSIMIRNTDIYFLCFKLEEVYKQVSLVFAKDDQGRIFIPKKPNPIVVNLCGNKYIEFEPMVKELDNGSQVIGVNIYLGSDSVFFFMNINMFLSFKYCIENFNMYQSAQLMLNYLGRPTNGTNMVDMTDNTNRSGYVKRGNNGNTKTFLQ